MSNFDAAEFVAELRIIQESVKDFSGMTKAEIKNFASSIGVTLSNSLTKDKMITAVKATEEFELSEVQRKNVELCKL